MDSMEKDYEVMSRKEINSYRHKSERRWYRGLIAVNFIIIFFTVISLIANMDKDKIYFRNLQNDVKEVQSQIIDDINESKSDSPMSDEEEDDEETDAMDKVEKRLDKFPADIEAVVFGIIILIGIPIMSSYVYGLYRSMSVKVTEKNFPEIHEIICEYTVRLGLKKMPEVYIIQENGILNAMSTFIPFKQYIELYADLVEVAYREHNDLESLRFIIGHEMSHIRLSHSSMHYNVLIWFANYIPILSSTASRAREYSCDRIAQHLAGNDGIDAIMSLTVGKHLYKRVDKSDYIENTKGFFIWLYNLFVDHPVTTKRILALKMKEGSGKLY